MRCIPTCSAVSDPAMERREALRQKFRQWTGRFFACWEQKTPGQLAVSSLVFLLGLLWPLGGAIVWLGARLMKRFRDLGTVALTGAALNLLLYLAQIAVRLAGAV